MHFSRREEVAAWRAALGVTGDEWTSTADRVRALIVADDAPSLASLLDARSLPPSLRTGVGLGFNFLHLAGALPFPTFLPPLFLSLMT